MSNSKLESLAAKTIFESFFTIPKNDKYQLLPMLDIMINEELKYQYVSTCGSGGNRMTLNLNADKSFVMNLDIHWMGSDHLKWNLSGTYQRNCNYYFLKVYDVNLSIFTSTGKEPKREVTHSLKEDPILTLDFIRLLNTCQVNCMEEREAHIYMGNGGMFNNFQSEFNAILSFNDKNNAFINRNNDQEIQNAYERLIYMLESKKLLLI